MARAPGRARALAPSARHALIAPSDAARRPHAALGSRTAVLRQPLPAVRLTIAGRPLECSTLLGYAGAYQLTLSSTVELGVELHSP